MDVSANVILSVISESERFRQIWPMFDDGDLQAIIKEAVQGRDATKVLTKPPLGSATFDYFAALQAVAAACTILSFFVQLYITLPRQTKQDVEHSRREAAVQASQLPQAAAAGDCKELFEKVADAIDSGSNDQDSA